MDKKEVAEILEEVAVLLEIKGEPVFKTLAYIKAARALLALPGDLDAIVQESGLKGIKGIGEGIRARILELHTTGRLAYYEELKASIPPGLTEMLGIPGFGPRKAKQVYDTLGIEGIEELERACREDRISALPGFGPKSQEKLIQSIAFLRRHVGQHLYSRAYAEAVTLLAAVEGSGFVIRASLGGSIRRRKEVVKDIDLLASSDNPDALSDFFASLPMVEFVTAKGPTKTSIVMGDGTASDLRIVTDQEFPYALHHFTGSAQHNAAMRHRAKGLGLKMNEYGLFRVSAETNIANIPCADETEIFAALGLAFIPPELREDMGEIEAAESGTLPALVTRDDLRGLLHIHSRYSDGKDEIEEIAEAAMALGYKYIGLTDHSQVAAYAGGLKKDDLIKQQEEIDSLNRKYAGAFRIFKGAEVDILPDGRLDYDEDTLSGFDFTVCSIHSKFNMTEDEATARIIRAMDDPHMTILGHPTGRLLLSRDGYPLNMRAIIEAAAERGVSIELNAHPQRLDIDWREIKYARSLGVKISINPDAHSLPELDVGYGVNIARKGWLERGDVLNSLDAYTLEAYFKDRKERPR